MYPVRFENINKSYNGKSILKNVCIEFEENKITALIGKSGSGKSTLLKMINGLVRPSSGNVIIFGKNLRDFDLYILRSRIGYSVQGTGLFPHLNVFKNITLLAGIKKIDSGLINDRVTYLMKLVNLNEDFRSKYPYQLSGGEQQRVGICRAMMMNPELFLLDEAFGALDITTKHEIHLELLKIQKNEPRTIILVTHDLNEAFRLAEKIVLIEKGELQQSGTKDEILNFPANDFVRYFLESQLN